MGDFILFLTFLGYLTWLLSAVTKTFHFSGMTSPVFGTVMILFLHIHVDLPMWIIWLFTVSTIWKIVRVIGQAEKPIYILTGIPHTEKSNATK